MKYLISILSLCILPFCLYGQQVTLGYDTVNVITVKQVESASKKIFSSCRLFCIKDQYYYGENFPFSSMMSVCKTPKDDLFNYDYTPLINKETVKKLLSALNKAKYTDINYLLSHPEYHITPALTNLITCLKKENNEEFLVSEQRFVAAYIMLDCETRRGVTSPVFCESNTILNRLPVILNVLKIIK